MIDQTVTCRNKKDTITIQRGFLQAVKQNHSSVHKDLWYIVQDKQCIVIPEEQNQL